MRSIRLSLMVCFLGLLAVALMAASLLVYRNGEQTLATRQRAMEQLLQAQYRERCQEEETKLDNALLSQAQALARLVQVQFDWSRTDLQPLLLLGLMSVQQGSGGYAPALAWLAEGLAPPRPPRQPRGEGPRPAAPRPEPPRPPDPPNVVFREVHARLVTGVKLKDEVLLPGDSAAGDYVQIDFPPGKPYLSPSMTGAGRSFPLDTSAFPADQLTHAVHDDQTIGRDIHVRRVVLKASGVETVTYWPGGPGGSGRPGGGQGRREAGRAPWVRHGPTIYVHCAAETSKRDVAIAALLERRDEEMGEVAARTQESLGDLRFRLLAISLAVFTATGIGGFWLVRLGLSPLHRLSDAVSRVSTRDFRLPLGERPLPLELRPIAERLNSTLDLLKRAFEREKQAAADISHELRTPLAALLTTTEFALRKPRAPEQYRELLNDVHASAQQMHQIVERLLTLARLDAGVDRLRVQPVDVAALARQCATVVRPLAEARGLKLTIDTPHPTPPPPGGREKEAPSPLVGEGWGGGIGGDGACLVPIDPDKLREVVTNLLHNAIQYNKPGGSIDLRVAREQGALEVEVRDTGIGIAPGVREHIFERFYRADPSRNCDELHAGLGLAIVKEYIDLMGGSIGVESTEGQGSTFRVRLPVRQE